MNYEEELSKLFDLPMFDDVRPAAPKITSDDRLAKSFEEINLFYEKHGRVPGMTGDLNEKIRCRELEAILNEEWKREYLLPYDRFGLLSEEKDPEKELESLFDSPLLQVDEAEIALFDLPEHLSNPVSRAEIDFKAQRERCSDFHLYEAGFKQVHKELKEGKRTLAKLKTTASIKEGTYFLLDGVILLLNKIYDQDRDEKGRLTGRTRCVFENGTETNILADTLRRAIYKEGFVIQESRVSDESAFKESFGIMEDDIQDGYIYVLRSLSTNSQIATVPNLYKIGFSTVPVEERIKNAVHEPTYLMDKVEEAARWKTLNMNTHTFENIIHRVFDCVQFHIQVRDQKGNLFTPREWFVVPLSIIKNVIERIVDGSIVNYHYNPELQLLEQNEVKAEKSESLDITGLAILSLNIKQKEFDKIIKGKIKEIGREIKQSKINTFTWVENETGNRYLRKFDALRLNVGLKSNSASVLVEVVNTVYYSSGKEVVYHLGKVWEHSYLPK